MSYTTKTITHIGGDVYDTGCHGCGCDSCTCSSCGSNPPVGNPTQGGCGNSDDHRHCLHFEAGSRAQYCPANIGTFSDATFVGLTNVADDGHSTDVQVKCTYSAINQDETTIFTTVPANFDDVTTSTIQSNWCNAITSPTNLYTHRDQCINSWGPSVGQSRYEQLMIQLCKSSSADWTTLTPCMNVVTSVIQTGPSNSNFSAAQAMAKSYCSIPENQKKQVCACQNAFNFGFYNKSGQTSNCFTLGNRDLPGCGDVIRATQPIVSLGNDLLNTEFQSVQTDSGHFTQYCDTASRTGNGGGILPYESQASFATASVILNVCTQIANLGLAKNSPISQKCSIVNNTGDGSGSSPSPSPSPSPSSNPGPNSTTIFIIIGIVLFLIMIFGLAIIVAI